jgi:hypothetical protein
VVWRVSETWATLHGEVDLNELIAITALREGAPEILDFIIRNIDAARMEAREDFAKAPKEVHDAWVKMTKENEQAALTAPLVDVLGIRQLSKSVSGRLQSVQDDEPTDYFRRLMSEDIREGEIRDQEVLADIGNWLSGSSTSMLEKLAAAKENHERYVDIWEYFAGEIPNERLNDVIDALFNAYLTTHPANMRLPALMSCWRQRNRRGDRQIVGPERLVEMAEVALNVSVAAANDLYYFWSSVRYGPFSEDDRKFVRKGMVEAAKRILVDSSRLIATLDVSSRDEDYLWSLRALVEPADQDESPSEYRDFESWTWLGPVIVEAAEKNPGVILPASARLVGDYNRRLNVRAGGFQDTYELKVDRLKVLFGDVDRRFLSLLASAPSQSEDWVVSEAQRQAVAVLRDDDQNPVR